MRVLLWRDCWCIASVQSMRGQRRKGERKWRSSICSACGNGGEYGETGLSECGVGSWCIQCIQCIRELVVQQQLVFIVLVSPARCDDGGWESHADDTPTRCDVLQDVRRGHGEMVWRSKAEAK